LMELLIHILKFLNFNLGLVLKRGGMEKIDNRGIFNYK